MGTPALSSAYRSNDAQTARTHLFPYWALLALCVLARALVVLRPIRDLDGLTIPDDCYYTLNLARSVARGLGPHTGLANTNGFQPLIAFLEVPSFWLLHGLLAPVRVAIVLTALADTAALALFGRMLLRQVRDRRVAWVAMFVWAMAPYAISTATNGLETSLAVCTLLAAASYFPRLDEGGWREFFVFGLLGGLAMLARVDAGLLLAIAAVLSAPRVFGRRIVGASSRGAATAAGVLLVNLPWWLFSLHYTGRLYPDSGRAVREITRAGARASAADGFHAQVFAAWHAIVGNQHAVLALLLVTAMVLAWRGGPAALRAWASSLWEKQRLLLLFAATLVCAYVAYIGGTWFFYRYFYVVGVVVLLATALTLDHAMPTLGRAACQVAPYAAAALFLLVTVLTREPPGMQDAGEPRTYGSIYLSAAPEHRSWMDAALWAEHEYPAGTVIGCATSGAMGYFAEDLTVVNLDGVVNHDAYEAMMGRRLLDYARSVDVEHLLVWGSTLSFIQAETASYQPGDLFLEHTLDVESIGKPWHAYGLAKDGARLASNFCASPMLRPFKPGAWRPRALQRSPGVACGRVGHSGLQFACKQLAKSL